MLKVSLVYEIDGWRHVARAPVKVVEKRVSEEVANGQAAMGGSFGP